ncbi:unnamed protein product [Prunus armeniaca]|uniref:AAA+ ATPase domain-containing protein n=1 Tax=Prunus armeniaca TaxID=36596 RepID=A0A6J5UE76_PRUAR|nr:unnamed protein product [Prunus armeniaca]CAB4303062.1 unnamed protein product [Prunus armeniaca]
MERHSFCSSNNTNTNNTKDKQQWRAEEATAGNAEALQALRELIIYPLLYSPKAQKLRLKWPRGLLLYGPPGTGKTSLVRSVVRECGAHLTVIRSHAGTSVKFLKEAFSEASSHALPGKPPPVIFIDEIDVLCPRRGSRSAKDRLACELIRLMDSNTSSCVSQVVFVACTNRVESIHPALRRHGRLDFEIEVTTPTEEERFQILKLYTRKLPLDSNINLQALAASSNGYVGADLEDLCRESTRFAKKRSSDANEDAGVFSVTTEDFMNVRSEGNRSITRGVTVEIPELKWEDIGGLKDVKETLKEALEGPLTYATQQKRLGISPMRGILLYGPPGCSKTTLAKAAAHATQACFFSLSGADLFSKYVGEGEALLRNTFRIARLTAPSIIFFDEVDIIGNKRGDSSSNNSTVGERILSTLLNEMDGLVEAKGVFVLAATNRLSAVDPALLRPGRFDLELFVPPPDVEGRYEILQVLTRKMSVADDVDLKQIATDTEHFTGAELKLLCKEAVISAMREDMDAPFVCNRHFQTAKDSVKLRLTKIKLDSYSSTSTAERNLQRQCKEFPFPLNLFGKHLQSFSSNSKTQ